MRLLDLQEHRLYFAKYKFVDQLETTNDEIEEKTERLKFVLEQLEFYGVPMKNLVLLSCGIEAE